MVIDKIVVIRIDWHVFCVLLLRSGMAERSRRTIHFWKTVILKQEIRLVPIAMIPASEVESRN